MTSRIVSIIAVSSLSVEKNGGEIDAMSPVQRV
jgi:hypothetical protein